MIKLDHVVYFTGKSPAEIVHEQNELGWHTVIGGRHEKWGTHNALMYVNNAYIEWLSVENETVAQNIDHQLVQQLLSDLEERDKWGTVCLSVKDMKAFNKKIISAGYDTSGILDSERKTVTGELLKWKMLFIKQEASNHLPLPFFIEWEDPSTLRYEKLRQEGTILEDNEKLEITSCIFNVYQPEQEAAKWAKLLGLEIEENHTITLANTVLVFREKDTDYGKERLTDVVIELR